MSFKISLCSMQLRKVMMMKLTLFLDDELTKFLELNAKPQGYSGGEEYLNELMLRSIFEEMHRIYELAEAACLDEDADNGFAH